MKREEDGIYMWECQWERRFCVLPINIKFVLLIHAINYEQGLFPSSLCSRVSTSWNQMPFNLNTFAVINKCGKVHDAVWSIFNERATDDAYSSVRAVLGSCGLDKLNSFQDNADGRGDLLNSCNASQLEQNKAQANIREVKQNTVARGLLLLLSMEYPRYTATPDKKAGVTSFPGHNLDWRTQTGLMEEGEWDKDQQRETYIISFDSSLTLNIRAAL